MGGMATWGYHDKVSDEEAFYARFKGLTDVIRDIHFCCGTATQLTDACRRSRGSDPRPRP
jgi:hypothetical protein